MTDGMDNLGQDEIEELLRQAAAGGQSRRRRRARLRPWRPVGPGRPSKSVRRHRAASSSAPATAVGHGPVDDDMQFLLAQAEQAIRSVNEPIENQIPHLAPFELRDLTGSPASTERASLELLRDVELDLRIELGRTHMYLEDVLAAAPRIGRRAGQAGRRSGRRVCQRAARGARRSAGAQRQLLRADRGTDFRRRREIRWTPAPSEGCEHESSSAGHS